MTWITYECCWTVCSNRVCCVIVWSLVLRRIGNNMDTCTHISMYIILKLRRNVRLLKRKQCARRSCVEKIRCQAIELYSIRQRIFVYSIHMELKSNPIFKSRLIDGTRNKYSYVCMHVCVCMCIGANNACYANTIDYFVVSRVKSMKNDWRILIIFRINTHRVHKIKEINEKKKKNLCWLCINLRFKPINAHTAQIKISIVYNWNWKLSLSHIHSVNKKCKGWTKVCSGNAILKFMWKENQFLLQNFKK